MPTLFEGMACLRQMRSISVKEAETSAVLMPLREPVFTVEPETRARVESPARHVYEQYYCA